MATFVGTNSSDYAIYVNAFYSTMYGLDGEDTLASNFTGYGVSDGGAGNDNLYFLESINGEIYGGSGKDLIRGGIGVDYL
jgi:Ca2+-binding RTX toxin-like protein